MMQVEERIHRLSPAQLRALFLLAKSEHGIISSTGSAKNIGKKGKSLGGVFSSLSRQKINNQSLILPWGKAEDGRGLKWHLNTRLISQSDLKKIVSELLTYA